MVSPDITSTQERLKALVDPAGFLLGLFNYVPVGIAIWKPDGHLLLTNKVFRDLFGSEPPPEYNVLKDELAAEAGILPLIQRAFTGETTFIPAFWYDPRDLKQVKVDGNRVAISMTVFPMLDADNKIAYVAATYKDETEMMVAQEHLKAEGEYLRQMVQEIQQEVQERKRAEEALLQSEQHFKALIQNSADVIELINPEGKVIYVSPSVTRALGYAPDELLGTTAQQIMHPDEFQQVAQTFGKVMGDTQGMVQVEQRLRHKDGTWRWVEVTATNLRHDPSVKAVVVNYHDITERRQAEMALRTREENARTFQEKLKSLNTVNIELSQTATMDELYQKAIVLGRERLGFDRLGLFLATEIANVAVGTYGTDAEGQLRKEDQFHFEVHDNTLNWDQSNDAPLHWEVVGHDWNVTLRRDVEIWDHKTVVGRGWNAMALLGNAESPIGWILADNLLRQEPLQDMQLELLSLYATTLCALIVKKRAEQLTLQLNEELEERVRVRTAELEVLNKELEAFSYSVSHDLRAPLRGIDGFSQILLEDYLNVLDKEGQEYLNRIRGASQRMGQLIEDLLKLSRLSRADMNHVLVDLSAVAQSIAADLQMGQPQRQVEFVISENLLTRADANLMRVVLENLLGNAWKYTGKHALAKIEFGVREEADTTVYFVRDDGAGFNMNYAEKLFAPFQRLHTPSEFEGIGIGLATVQRIVHRHGGRVWAEAAVEQGATFYFTLMD